MNILVVSAMYPPIRTGTSHYVDNLTQALAGLGHAVSIVTVMNREADSQQKEINVVRLPALFFPLKNFFKHFRVTSFFPGNYLRLKTAAQKADADVILLVNHYLDIAFPAIFASITTKTPLVCSVGTQLQSLNPFRNRVLRIMDRMICGGMVFPFCDAIISWDKEISRYLSDRQGETILAKTHLAPYGVYGNVDAIASHNHEYAFKPQILCVGSVIEQRSFVSVVRMFNRLLEREPELKLKIIGHVYYDAAVRLSEELGIQNRVEFMGEQSHDFVLNELKRSMIFWHHMTGEYVGLGTASIEAMLMGVPVVTNVPEDLLGDARLTDNETVVRVSDASSDDALDKVAALAGDEEMRRRIGLNGRAFVQAHMNWDAVATRIAEILEFAVDPRKRENE